MLRAQVPAHGIPRASALSVSHLHKAKQLPVLVACCGMAKTVLSIVKRPAVSRDAVAIPPTAATMQLTALVEHILVQREGALSEVIADELDISPVRL